METTDVGSLISRERGAALIMVMIALALLLPMALVVSQLVISRQRQSTGWRETVTRQYAVRGAYRRTQASLEADQIRLTPSDDLRMVLDVGQPVRVQLIRQPDVVVTLDGTLLPAKAVKQDEQKRIGIDLNGREVRQYQRLEIYLVEAEAEGGPSFPSVRLLGGLARLESGAVVSLGYRLDRG